MDAGDFSGAAASIFEELADNEVAKNHNLEVLGQKLKIMKLQRIII